MLVVFFVAFFLLRLVVPGNLLSPQLGCSMSLEEAAAAP
jgi:hypothetical protein